MTTPQPPTKPELLAALRDGAADALARLRALPPAEFERGRYESGWNGRQILAHIASIEWTYPKLIDVAKEVAPPRSGEGPGVGSAAGPPTRIAQGGILSYNDRQVAKRAEASVAELLAEFEQNRAATIAAVEGVDEALLAKEIRSAGGITGPLAGVINAVAVLHVQAHVNDIVGAAS